MLPETYATAHMWHPFCVCFCSVQNRWMKWRVLLPDPPRHFSVCRTSSILGRDHPPDKKPKSDKASVPPAQDFDSTGKPFYRSSIFCLMLLFWLWVAVGQDGKLCTVCGLRGELKCSVLLTLMLSSQNGISCPLFKAQTPSHCRGTDSNSAVIQPSWP